MDEAVVAMLEEIDDAERIPEYLAKAQQRAAGAETVVTSCDRVRVHTCPCTRVCVTADSDLTPGVSGIR